MKLLSLALILLSLQSFAGDIGIEIYKGITNKTLFTAPVKVNFWLDSAESVLEREHDFHENVSYVGEVWDEVEVLCDLSQEQSEEAFESSEVSVETKWSKIVDLQGKSKAYFMTLFARLSGDFGVCDFPRGTYVIGKDKIEISSDSLWKKYRIDFSDFL
jgi:hypothetical protein